MLIILYARFN